MYRLVCACLIMMLMACSPEQQPAAEPTEVGITRTPAPPTFSPLAITPVVVADLPTLTPPCDESPRSRLILQERGLVSNEDTRVLNIRSEPSTEGTTILGTLKVFETFLVLDGPRCDDGYTWYLIESKGLEGWIAEGDLDVYYVEPYLPG